MTPLERAGHLVHARSRGFLRRLDAARTAIAETLRRAERPYVAYSAGKDSTVLLWLVREQAPAVPAWLLTREESRTLHGDLDAMLRWWRHRGASIHETACAAVGRGGEDWAAHERNAVPIRALAPAGHDAVLLGLRAAESRGRRIALANGPLRTIRHQGGTILRSAPLARWSTADVAALLVAHDLPYLAAYAVDGFATRTAMRLNATGLCAGAVGALKRRDPGGCNRLLRRFPELAGWV